MAPKPPMIVDIEDGNDAEEKCWADGLSVRATMESAGGGGPAPEEKESAGGAAEGRSVAAKGSGKDGGGETGAPALDEILRHVRYLSARVEEAGKRETGRAGEEAKQTPPSDETRESDSKEAPMRKRSAAADSNVPDALRVQRADFGRWVEAERRTRRRWAVLAMAAGFPAALLLGVLVEQQFQVIPLHDPTGGWSGWVWETHGRAIVNCASEAMRTNAEVDCPLVVRRP